MIRLPLEYSQIIGQRAHVYKTDHDRQLAFLLVPYTEATSQLATESKSRVSKLSLETEAESRLSALESQIAELKLLAFQSASYTDSESKKRSARVGI